MQKRAGCYRIRKYVGAYLAALGGAHAVVFTGAIGERSSEVRARVCQGLEPHVGRGGWTWYAGSAGWLYRAGIEWLLGLRVQGRDWWSTRAYPPDGPGSPWRSLIAPRGTTSPSRTPAGSAVRSRCPRSTADVRVQ